MNVLSLFDGMSCGQIALKKLGVRVDNYFACEIDKYAIKVTMDNFPDTKQLGDVTKVDFKSLPKIDLLIGGSPCQGFSFAGKQLNFNDPRSKLFFEFIKVKAIIKPKYFLLENVPMKKEYLNTITNLVGVEPIKINSALVSAQKRERYYWTNIPNLKQPEDRKIYLRDILETDGTPINYSSSGRGQGKVESRISEAMKAYTLTKSGYSNRSITTVSVYHLPHGFNKGGIFDREKMPSLRKDSNNNYFIINGEQFRKLTLKEHRRLQTIPDWYKMEVSNNQAFAMLGNGWTVDVIVHILKGIINE